MRKRSRFPRVAPHTRPRPEKPPLIKLPPLLYGIHDSTGELQRIEQVEDPRNGICNAFNGQAGQGSFATPLEIGDGYDASPRRRKAVGNG